MPIPIAKSLLKPGAQMLGRVAREAGKLATSSPGLAEKAKDAGRLASKTMSGLGGLNARLPSKLPSAATMQQGLAGLRPRLQNASSLLGQMGGRLGQVAQLAQMLPTGSTGPTAPAGPATPTRPSGPTKPMGKPGHIPLGQFGAIRDKAHAALKGPMGAALHGSDRAAHVAGAFLQALHDIESSALYQNFAPALVNQMLGEAKTGLQAINDLIQRFQSGLGKLDSALQPPPSAAKPPPLPARPNLPKPSTTSSAAATVATSASASASTAAATAAFTTAPTSPATSASTPSSATSTQFFSAPSTPSTAPTTPTTQTTGPAK